MRRLLLMLALSVLMVAPAQAGWQTRLKYKTFFYAAKEKIVCLNIGGATYGAGWAIASAMVCVRPLTKYQRNPK